MNGDHQYSLAYVEKSDYANTAQALIVCRVPLEFNLFSNNLDAHPPHDTMFFSKTFSSIIAYIIALIILTLYLTHTDKRAREH